VPVYFLREANTGRAVWCSEDGAEEIVLCSVGLAAYESEAAVRDRFAELVNAVADYHRRNHVVEAVDRATQIAEALPYCSKCSEPEAAEILHQARQASDLGELRMSASGLYPLNCCRVKTVGAFGGRPDTPRAAARR
jgi:hypothetical protein